MSELPVDSDLLEKGLEIGVVALDETNDQVTYRLGREAKYKWSDPEEPVRANAILTLVFRYQYSPLRIETEVSVPSRTPTGWADVVVFRDDRRKDPFITVEAAAPQTTRSESTQKVEQLFGYANSLASAYAMYTRGPGATRFWRVRGEGGLEREQNEVAQIPANYGETPRYTFVRSSKDLRAVSTHKLSRIFDSCHNELWSGGRLDPIEAFDEMSKLIFAKLYDEQNTRNDRPYGFQWGDRETDIMVASRVLTLYDSARKQEPEIFAADIRSEPRKIAKVVRSLQHVSLTRTDADAKGRAFEQFLGEVLRGRLGQYFTRREIVEFMVALAQPTMDDVLLDPACGSGGFLVNAMKHVFKAIEEAYEGDEDAIVRQKIRYAQARVYGVEINETIARAAMMDMVINDDGHTNIQVGSALNARFDNAGIRDGSFSMILTNPPFGDKVKSDDTDKLGDSELSDFALSREKASVKSEVVFIERCTRFLRPGGLLAMVVPDGVLSNPSDKYVREYLLENYRLQVIVTLPAFAFRKAGSGMKTSVLVARKLRRNESGDSNYDIFMALAERIGYDSTTRPDHNELPSIVAHYESGTGSLEERIMNVTREALGKDLRLDPLYYYLGPIIESGFQRIPHPAHTLREVASEPIQSGKAPKGGAQYSSGSVPIILIGNIAKDGSVDLDRDPCFADDEFFESHSDKAGVRPLDILIAKDGATTGKIGLVPPDFPAARCLINEHIFRLRVGAVLPGDCAPLEAADWDALRDANTWYAFFFLQSALGQQQIEREVSGGAQGGITKGFVNRIRIPVLPVEERLEFVIRSRAEYDRYLASVRRTNRQYAALMGELDRIGQVGSGREP